MENMSIDDLQLLCKMLNDSTRSIYNSSDPDADWDLVPDSQKELLLSLNDKFNQYPTRLLPLPGRRV